MINDSRAGLGGWLLCMYVPINSQDTWRSCVAVGTDNSGAKQLALMWRKIYYSSCVQCVMSHPNYTVYHVMTSTPPAHVYQSLSHYRPGHLSSGFIFYFRKSSDSSRDSTLHTVNRIPSVSVALDPTDHLRRRGYGLSSEKSVRIFQTLQIPDGAFLGGHGGPPPLTR